MIEDLAKLAKAARPAAELRTQGLYFLFYRGHLVYIGQSGGCEVRINGHMLQGIMKFDSYALLPLETNRAGRMKIEKQYVRRFFPVYNMTMQDNRPTVVFEATAA